MKAEYENKLINEFTFIKDKLIECGNGWFQLIYELCKKIESVYEREGIEPDIIVDAIHEKYGVLHFDHYFENTSESLNYQMEIGRLISDYEDMSETICEECGATTGVLRNDGGWLSVLCDDCYGR